MKKLWLIVLIGLALTRFSSVKVYADDVYVYEFDSITINEAYRFQIKVMETPLPGSVLEGHVQVDETITVYVGSLSFANGEVVYLGNEKMIVLTNSLDFDIIQCLHNSYSTDLATFRTDSFGNWKVMDPEVGVVKDFTIPNQYEITVKYLMGEDKYQFIDNIGVVYDMVVDSYEYLPDLNIVVKAYIES